MLRENCRVRTLIEKQGFHAGTLGVIVSVYKAGPACEVELWDEKENPMDVVTFMLDELEEVPDSAKFITKLLE